MSHFGLLRHRVRVAVRDKTDAYGGEESVKGIIIRRKAQTNRKDGSYIKFDENAFCVIQKNKAKGTKLKGPVGYEVQHSCKNLARWIF